MVRGISYILLLCILVSCEREIELETQEFNKKLVLNTFNASDSLITINISTSINTLGVPKLNYIDGFSDIILIEDESIIISEEVPINKGIILLPYICKPGSTYEVQIGYTDYPSIRAIDSVPLTTPFISLDTMTSTSNQLKIRINTDKLISPSKYLLQLHSSGKQWKGIDTIQVRKSLNFSSNDKIFHSNILTISSDNSFVLFDDKTITSGDIKTFELIINSDSLSMDNFIATKIEVRLSSISETTYKYYVNLLENTHIYGGPLANIIRQNGNVENGLGIFGFYNQATAVIALP